MTKQMEPFSSGGHPWSAGPLIDSVGLPSTPSPD
jgi:hypothetical protein